MKKPIQRSTFIIILTIFFEVIIVVKAFKWVLMDLLFLFYYIFIILYVVIGIVFMTIIFILLIKNKQRIIAVISICLCLTIIILPIDSYFENTRFSILKNKMEQTAQHVINGDYAEIISENRTIILPDKLQHLSRGGGEVTVIHNDNSYAVIFFTDRGMPGNFSGYVYMTDSNARKLLKEYEDWDEIKFIDSHWYYYVCTD